MRRRKHYRNRHDGRESTEQKVALANFAVQAKVISPCCQIKIETAQKEHSGTANHVREGYSEIPFMRSYIGKGSDRLSDHPPCNCATYQSPGEQDSLPAQP